MWPACVAGSRPVSFSDEEVERWKTKALAGYVTRTPAGRVTWISSSIAPFRGEITLRS